jgi:hypothetical protein
MHKGTSVWTFLGENGEKRLGMDAKLTQSRNPSRDWTGQCMVLIDSAYVAWNLGFFHGVPISNSSNCSRSSVLAKTGGFALYGSIHGSVQSREIDPLNLKFYPIFELFRRIFSESCNLTTNLWQKVLKLA